MVKESFSRTALLLGEELIKKLDERVHVAVFGIGGVGGYAAEALARSGVGALDLIDNDVVCESNLNRQIIALRSTQGQYKAEVMAQRIADINPQCRTAVHCCFYLPETQEQFDFTQYDYIVDAIDTVTGKIALAEQAQKAGTPIISSMGTGNKLCPAMLEVADIYETSVCPLARVMRRELKKRGISSLKVVYSKEEPIQPADREQQADVHRKSTPGSMVFVPAAAGLLIASEVVKDLVQSWQQPDHRIGGFA